MTNNYNEVAKLILEQVGGAKNIKDLTHCVTRLRFVLINEDVIDKEIIESIPLVKGSFYSNGQFQIIIGTGIVDKLFDEIKKESGTIPISSEEIKEVKTTKTNVFQRSLKTFSDIFIPILPAIVGAGILLGLGNILTSSGIFGVDPLVVKYPGIKGIADLILMIANTAFTYIPVLVAWSSVKRFGGNPLLGIFLGLVLINDQLLPGSQMSSVINGTVTPEYWNILGLKVIQMGYQNSVLPPLVAAWVLVFLEKKLKKYVPAALQLIVVAPVSILTTSFLTFLAIGPAMNYVASLITNGIMSIFDFSPIFAGFLFGFLWEPLVVTGMHHAFIAVNIQLIAQTQQSFMLSIITIACVAEAGADFAMFFLNKSKQKRSIAISAGTSSLLGVTEPSMFGITIPAKFPFICSIICSGFAGSLIMIFKIYAISLGPAGPLSFTIIPVQFWGKHFLIMGLTFVLAFLSTFLYGRFTAYKNLNIH